MGGKERKRRAFFSNENWPEILQGWGWGMKCARDLKTELGAEVKGLHKLP